MPKSHLLQKRKKHFDSIKNKDLLEVDCKTYSDIFRKENFLYNVYF